MAPLGQPVGGYLGEHRSDVGVLGRETAVLAGEEACRFHRDAVLRQCLRLLIPVFGRAASVMGGICHRGAVWLM